MKEALKLSKLNTRTLYSNYFIKDLAILEDYLIQGAEEYYRRIGLQKITAPEIVGITGACENVDTLFKVSSRKTNPLFFTQTGQLSLEQALQFFDGVFCVIQSGRDEDPDARHLNEFTLIEEEFCCTHPSLGMSKQAYNEDIFFDKLLEHIENVIKNMILHVIQEYNPAIFRHSHIDMGYLKDIIIKPFYRISYTDAITLLQKEHVAINWGEDLNASHEQAILEIIKEKDKLKDLVPTFITHFPEEIKFFNMKEHEKNPKVVNSADLILPYSGESVGSAVREHNYDKLLARLLKSDMFKILQKQGIELKDFEWYFSVIKSGRVMPHAGYGIGLQRVVQFILQEHDIRNSSSLHQIKEQMY